MSLEQVFCRFWRLLSLPILVFSLLFCYYSLPDTVAIHHNSVGKPDGFVSKETFFYVMVALIITFNVLASTLKNAFLKVPDTALPQHSSWVKARQALNLTVEGYVNLFVAIINTYLIICIIALNRINRSDGQMLDMNYNWVLLVGAFLLMILIFYLPLKLLYSKPQLDL